jgi:Ni/Fe-hydrogenase subunit HybB-like protein
MHGTPFVFPNDTHVAWSIMIVLYPYITGLVAGAFVVSALYHVFHNHSLKPVARLSLVMALCFCAFATVPLLLHLHHPERALNVMITPNTSSAMAGFGFIYSFYMLLLCVEVWLIFRAEIVDLAAVTDGIAGRILRVMSLGSTEVTAGSRMVDQRLIGLLAVLGIPAACVLHGYVGFLFGGIKANPWWSTALMPVIFLASAIVSGIAALLLFYLVLSWVRRESIDFACVHALLKNLWIALVIAFTLEMLELLHIAYEAGSDWHVIRELLTKHLAVSYGVVQILIGSIVPLLLLPVAFQLQKSPRLMTVIGSFSSILVLVQVFAMRWNVVIGGQLFSKSHRGFVEYHLAWGGREGLIAAVVVLLLPVIVLLAAGRRLPLQEAHECTVNT